MVPTYTACFSGEAKAKESALPTPEEQQGADAQGVSVAVYRLQQHLRRLPLVPRDEWLRKKRAHLVEKLFASARRDRCLKNVNPWAASDSTVRLPQVPR
jgi:hypothetical protein